MKEYELTVLVHPDLEADIDKALDKVRAIIKSAKGKISKEDNWGKKKLAYNIKKQDFAVYVCMNLDLPVDAPLKINNALNITDEILRYLLIAVDAKSKQAQEQAKQAQDNESNDSNKEEE